MTRQWRCRTVRRAGGYNSFKSAETPIGVRTNFNELHGRGAKHAPQYPSGFDLITPPLRGNRISACIGGLPPELEFTMPVTADAPPGDVDKIELPLP
jgi:hypothetical protein